MLPMTKGFTGHGACYMGRNDDIGSSFRSRDNMRRSALSAALYRASDVFGFMRKV